MENVIQNLLESDALDPEIRKALSEEWESKLTEARSQIREEVEESVRSEFARRFESDREKMVAAMDSFITEAVTKELTEFAQDRKEVLEARAKLARLIKENNEKVKETVANSAKMLESFCIKKINEEISEFHADRKALNEERIKIQKELEEEKLALQEAASARIAQLEGFVMKKLHEEISEFEQDKNALVEQKVKLAAKAKEKLEETRREFVSRSSKLMAETLNKALRTEFKQFREDIRVARENHFGRKLFEAFAAEYMTSYLNEGSEVKKLQSVLDAKAAQMQDTMKKLEEQQEVIQKLNHKIKLTEEASKRLKVMNELLSPLGREKRVVMEEILSNVKTDRLAEAFKKHLPAVLNETRKETRRPLTEAKTSSVITGNRETKQPSERVVEEMNSDIIQLRKLAGIK